ncbi:asparagine synthase (glutamine-hydrolyzing) [Aggregatilinea lenta]|uniref:asparagine synthase (glutamine-hydrolyzing) n=1 Tax=Aggregatilinea lenta TaxID=913108 RepID=UPI000E5AC146|nr:asparagine synthase (glutamine-hydrolyzing) [Aggregatilinea lenta]
MCGIVGILDQTHTGRADPALVRAMTQTIAHRGPDGDGFFHWPESDPTVALGMRRLSIIDLDTGDQPIFNEDGSIAIVFNGEIYNYLELRADLEARGHVFRTQTDTETIVHLYEEHGLDLFGHLRGMYGFALWDRNAGRLVLAVDHIGIKPLYLAERDGLLLFASEVKALFADPSLPRRLNLDVLDTYLTFGYMIGTETMYAGIRRLPPGHALIAENGATRLIRHWTTDYPPEDERPTDEAAIIEEARTRLAESVRLHLRSDVPLGLFLSGGIDSAALLALMAQMEPGRIKTFSVGYDVGRGAANPDDETLHARRIAAHFGTDHHERIITADDWWRFLLAYAYYHDEPNANPSIVSLQALAEVTAQHVKVVLNGTGGDELFCGYPSHRRFPWVIRNSARLDRVVPNGLRTRLIGAPWRSLEALYPTLRRVRIIGALPAYLPTWHALFLPLSDGLRRLASFEGLVFSEPMRQRLYGPDLRAAWAAAQHKERTYADILARAWADDPGDTAQALALHTWLPGNGLLAVDKVTMAHSLEARVPFFDPQLMDFAMRVPSAIRLRSNKYVLREAMRDDLPDFARQRPKQPFGTPILRWFDTDLSERIQSVLLDEHSLSRGLFEQAALERLLRQHFGGQTEQVEVVFRLLLLELWQRATLDAPPHIPEPSSEAVRIVEPL